MKKPILFGLACLLALLAHAQDLENIQHEKPVRFTGAVNTGTSFYHISGIPDRAAVPLWYLNGSANLNLYGALDLPFSFAVGKQSGGVSYPTFRQFGVSPKYKWLTLHGGYRNMTFSPYTLAGHTFLGAGIELKPGKFRFAAMNGRLRKAREYNPDEGFQYFPAVYKRTGWGMKIGVGTDNDHFDLIYFDAKDDRNSLHLPLPDSSLTPAANRVIGFNFISQISSKISWFADGAVSAFTRNVNSYEVEDVRQDVTWFFKPKYSSRVNYAVKTGLDFRFKSWGLRTAFERVMPEYETMGAFFFSNDRQNLTISPNFGLWKHKVIFNGTLGLQRDNLLGQRYATNRRLIGNANLSVNPSPHFGFDINYTNLEINQLDGRLELSDTIRVAIVNSGFGLTPHWQWADSTRAQAIVFSGNYQEVNDRNPFTREFTNMDTWFFTSTYSLNFIQSNFGVNLGTNYTKINIYQLQTDRYGGTLGVSKTFFENKLNTSVSTTYNITRIGGEADGSVVAGSLNASIAATKKLSFGLTTSLTKNSSKQFDDFIEWIGGVNLNVRL